MSVQSLQRQPFQQAQNRRRHSRKSLSCLLWSCFHGAEGFSRKYCQNIQRVFELRNRPEQSMKGIAEQQNMERILIIASRKSPLRHGDETMENGRASARVFSALMGSLECLALQALDGSIVRILSTISRFAITGQSIFGKERMQDEMSRMWKQ